VRRAILLGAILLLLPGGAPAEAPPCESEVMQLRFLVQKYGQERTALEFALARAEAERQRLRAELDRLGGR